MPNQEQEVVQLPDRASEVEARYSTCATLLCEKISAQLPEYRERLRRLIQDHGETLVSKVTIEQIYGGLRGVTTQVSDVSYVDPQEGIRLRGHTIPELLETLPKAPGSAYPLVGGVYYLLMVNQVPTLAEARAIETEWQRRAQLPDYLVDVLRALPRETHPMALFSTAILALQAQSVFSRDYEGGLTKKYYWKAMLEDSLDLTAKLPSIAALIYNLKYQDGRFISPNPGLGWAANLAQMIGKGDSAQLQDLFRLFMLLHCDHEGGNVSAHAATLVSSALSDVYYSCSAGMDGLAGPLHGLANQESLRFLIAVRRSFPAFPSREQVAEAIWKELNAGRVIPGFGHAVLRKTDPRFTALLAFGQQYLPEDELFRLASWVAEIAPGILTQLGKVKNPWPNVDAISGSLLYHYGLRELEFYTLLFGVSRILGLTTSLVWARALGKPIERPKSVTTRMLEDLAGESAAKAAQ